MNSMKLGLEDRTISINYNETDYLMLELNRFYSQVQNCLEETEALLSIVADICQDMPSSVSGADLMWTAEQLKYKLSHSDCMYEGNCIIRNIQELTDNLYSVEDTYTKEMVNNGVYFENASVTGEVPMRYTAGAGFIEEIELDDEAIALAGQKAIAYDLIISHIYQTYGYDIREGGITEEEAAYIEEIRLYLEQNYTQVYNTYVHESNSPQSRYETKVILQEEMSIYIEAKELQSQLLGMEYPYEWDKDFLSMENCIKLIRIFKRNNVDSDEKRSYFLAQIYAESQGGDLRENLEDCNEQKVLDEYFDEELATSYVLKYKEKYFKEEWPKDMTEDEFIRIVSESNDDDYHCNNLYEEFVKDISDYIGDVDPSLFKISDIVKYRGGGLLQLTHKENYYRLAYYIETEYGDKKAAEDIRANGCYSSYITDDYYLEVAEWVYFKGPRKVKETDTFKEITIKIRGASDDRRNEIQQKVYEALST